MNIVGRWRTVLSALVGSALVFLNVLYLFVGDGTVWGEYLTIWPPILWAYAFLIPLLVVCFAAGKRQSVILFSLWALFLGSTEEWASLFRSQENSLHVRLDSARAKGSAETAEIGIRLTSWNVSGTLSAQSRCLEFLAGYEPDICLFQETPDQDPTLEQGNFEGYWKGFHWLDAGDCGILSRYPLKPLATEPVGPWPPVQIVSVQPATGSTFLLANVHLAVPSLVLNPLSRDKREYLVRRHKERVGQFGRLAKLIQAQMAETGNPSSIVAGDFNTPASQWSLDPLREFLSDVWLIRGVGWGRTITNQFPVSRIDQCWVTEDVTVASASVHRADISDHRVLLVDLLIPRN
ncbi:MAG: hypothetical protein GHCLOJNM_02095 [bacterium]|nr:hypothetical protein [bacterium]